jgi:hypothetical protein
MSRLYKAAVIKSLYSLFFFAVIIFSSSTFAKDEDQGDFSSKNSEIHISIDDKTGAREKIYQDFIKNLNDDQKSYLKKLDLERTKSNESSFTILDAETKYKACLAQDKLFEQYQTNLQTLRYTMEDDLAAKRKAFSDLAKKTNFIDWKILAGHFDYSQKLETSLLQGMQQVSIQHGVYNAEKCSQFKRELIEKYAVPYAVEIVDANLKSDITRDETSGVIEACVLSWRNENRNGRSFSSVLVYALPEQGKSGLTYSLKTIQSGKGHLPIAEAWIDFGTVNTRYKSLGFQSNQNLFIGGMSDKYIVDILLDLQKDGIVSSVKAAGEDRAVVFKTPVLAKDDLDKFSSCVASLNPRTVERLKKAGLSTAVDERHAKATADGVKKNNFVYKVSKMSDDPVNPKGCLWEISAAQTKENEFGGALVFAGFVESGHPYNYKAVFWLLGNDRKTGERLIFSDGWYETKDVDTGEVLDTRKLQKNVVRGERHEIYMAAGDTLRFIKGIARYGVTLHAKTANAEEWLEHNYPPAEPQSVAAYKSCLGELAVGSRKVRDQRSRVQ